MARRKTPEGNLPEVHPLDPTRDGYGQFQKGCKGGPGRPRTARVKLDLEPARHGLQSTVDLVPEMVAILAEMARKKDNNALVAIRQLLDRGLPISSAAESHLVSRIEELESLVEELEEALGIQKGNDPDPEGGNKGDTAENRFSEAA